MMYVAVKVTESPGKGKGIFVTQPVKKGQKVMSIEGPVLSWEKAVAIGRENHVFPVGIDEYIDMELECTVNHSCNPNLGFADDRMLSAIKDIKPGDELTFDYSLVTIDGWRMQCSCGAKNCRHLIGDYMDLPPETKKAYKDVTPKWVLEADKTIRADRSYSKSNIR